MKSVFDYFFNHDFELSNLQDLRDYSFEELKSAVLKLNKKFSIRKKIFENGDFIATFRSNKSNLVLMYTSTGVFKYKLKDKWLNFF
jgi:hypothetical protein